jgi:hypothetical protein
LLQTSIHLKSTNVIYLFTNLLVLDGRGATAGTAVTPTAVAVLSQLLLENAEDLAGAPATNAAWEDTMAPSLFVFCLKRGLTLSPAAPTT